MKKLLFLICAITIIGCSKNETTPSMSSSKAEISHLNDCDLDLVDGSIQLIISKEDAIDRGVSAFEYDLVKNLLVKHNNGKGQSLTLERKEKTLTKSGSGSTLAWGVLFYKYQDPQYDGMNQISPFWLNADDVTLYYTFDGISEDYANHTLVVTMNGPGMPGDIIIEPGDAVGYRPFTNVTDCMCSLYYSFSGYDLGVCIYDIRDGVF